MLSIRSVQLFNDHPVCTHLAIKPCCTPPIQLAKQKTVWQLGGHTIRATDVCVAGKFHKGRWVGAPQTEQRDKFSCWCHNLEAAVDGGPQGATTVANWQLLAPRQDDPPAGAPSGAAEGASDSVSSLIERSDMEEASEGGQHSKRYQTVFIYASRPWSVSAETGGVSQILQSSKDKTQPVAGTQDLQQKAVAITETADEARNQTLPAYPLGLNNDWRPCQKGTRHDWKLY